MNKVVVSITPNDYKVTVSLNGVEYYEKHVRTETGSRQIEGKNFEDVPEIPDELYDALSSFFAFDVMEALAGMEE